MLILQAVAAADAWQNLNNFLAGVNFQKPTWDLVIIVFFLAAAFIYGLSLGRERILIVLISIYMAFAVISAAPWFRSFSWQSLGDNRAFIFPTAIFLASFILIFYWLSRSPLLSALGQSQSPGEWWQVILFSILHVGLLISITLSFLPPVAYGELAPLTRQLFTGSQTLFYWIIAPILALSLIKAKKEQKDRFY